MASPFPEPVVRMMFYMAGALGVALPGRTTPQAAMDGPYEHLSRDELIDRLKADEAIRRELELRRASLEERERLMHALQVHQAELEAQNQALREAQGLLEESRSRYADLYDFAPIAYCTFDAAGL